ncbi:MAG: HAMP domain-containing protein [Chloroflexi bacterium]|nr:HAMP domain-containing protein [Chloroflexota bacterium]
MYSSSGVFKGVLGADIKLASIADRIANISISPSSIAFLVDKNGFVLAMPEAGYQMFGLQPEVVPVNESPKLSILSTDSEIMLFVAQRVVISRSNLLTLPVEGVQTYLAIASLGATEYKLVILAPVNELNQEILASRSEIQNEVAGVLRNASVILVLLIIGSLAVSLLIGQFITRPLKRLTNTVEEIAGGNLTARVKIESQDETGLLARSFNTMADRLNETLRGLEEKVAERTRELERISASNAYRARQFEAIARIANTISSTQTLNRLLPQIAETISEQLGFYHVGIFLLDVHKEYAVLTAANSEGGRRMLARNHRLRVGEVGIVGFVTRSASRASPWTLERMRFSSTIPTSPTPAPRSPCPCSPARRSSARWTCKARKRTLSRRRMSTSFRRWRTR